MSGKRKFRHGVGNLGGGGLFIHSPLALREGAELTLCFRPTPRTPVLRVKAKVRFIVPGMGFGVEFVRISRAAQQALLKLVHRRTIGRRRGARVPLVAQVQFGQNQPLGWIKDISLGGVFVETSKPPAPGAQVLVRFNLPTRETITMARGMVTYSLGEKGMGLQFVDISEEDLAAVQAYIEKNLPRARRPKIRTQNRSAAPTAESPPQLSRAGEPASETPTGSDRNPERPPALTK